MRLGDLREKKETSSRKKVNAVVCFCIEIQWTTALIFDEQVLPFIVLEPNLLMVSNRCLDIVNDVVNLFIMRFDTAG